jgi:hypothetical protein
VQITAILCCRGTEGTNIEPSLWPIEVITSIIIDT